MLSHQLTHPKSTIWKVDYKDHVNNRKRYRRLVPCSRVASSHCGGFYKTDALLWNGHPSSASSQQAGKEENAEPIVNSRWNPTPEQVMALQEMYERGVRTPSADEIQLITAKLSKFGKIEGKNVFYWFQNHKARERQKRRRQTDSYFPIKHAKSPQPKERGLMLNVLEAEGKMEPFTPLCCIKNLKGSASMHRAVATKNRYNGWTDLDERENQLLKTIHNRTKKGSDSLLDLSFMPYDFNTIGKSSISEDLSSGNKQKQSSSLSLNISLLQKGEDSSIKVIPKQRNNQMLQLFPSLDDNHMRPEANAVNEDEFTTTKNLKFTPKQFYEFL